MKANVLIKRILPDFEDRLLLRRVLYMPRDIFDTILGRRPAMMPPWGLRFVGDGDFTEIGERIVGFLRRFSGLRPEDSILDAGCGIGRLAVPLTNYLTTGSYEGFDIVRPAIRWCTRNITSKHQNFRFTWADIYNKHYNPKGQLTATTWKFPYQDSSFDVVVLSSVFTHMLPDGFRAYLAEVFRVLKPNGRCWSSLFLLNSESRELMSSGRAVLKLPHRYSEHCFVLDPRFPEQPSVTKRNSSSANIYVQVFIRLCSMVLGAEEQRLSIIKTLCSRLVSRHGHDRNRAESTSNLRVRIFSRFCTSSPPPASHQM